MSLAIFLDNLMNKNLEEARENINAIISQKAMESLNEKKKDIASIYFTEMKNITKKA